jgi:hypothetical protein
MGVIPHSPTPWRLGTGAETVTSDVVPPWHVWDGDSEAAIAFVLASYGEFPRSWLEVMPNGDLFVMAYPPIFAPLGSILYWQEGELRIQEPPKR